MQDLLHQHEISDKLIQAFSWMLVHSLWQGVLLSLLTAVALRFAHKASAALRYNLVLANFGLFLFTCLFTFIYECSHVAVANGPVPSLAAHAADGSSPGSIQGRIALTIAWCAANVAMVSVIWSTMFAIRFLQLLRGVVYLHRAKTRYTDQPGRYWLQKLEMLRNQLQLTVPVRLLTSGLVQTPMVIGHLKPLILIPAGLMAGLPPGQLEAVLLHELAHINRRDYLVNLLQTFAETFFCFNPGLLWLSALLREEREYCCDDIALSQSGSRQDLVDALINCKKHALYGERYMVAFPGRKNHLLFRIKRILGRNEQRLTTGDKSFFLAGLLGLFLLLAAMSVVKVGGTSVHPHAALKKRPEMAIAVIKPHHVTPIPKRKNKPITIAAVPRTTEKVLVILPDSISDAQQAGRDKANALRDRAVAINDRIKAITGKVTPIPAKVVPATEPIKPIGRIDDQ